MFKTLFFLFVFLSVELAAPFTTTPLLAENYSQVTAHRGSSAVTPENTLRSFRQAIIDRAGIAELDVQETADGVLMVMHDDNVLRTTGINKNMWEITSSELKEANAGGWRSPEFQNEHVPTLDEVIGIAKGHIKLNIEMKNNGHGKLLAEKTANLIHAHDFEKECTVTSFDVKLLATVKKLNPKIKTGLIVGQKSENMNTIMDCSDYDVISAAYPLVTESFMKLAKTYQKEVYVWTVNQPTIMKQMLGLGVSSIITDHPDQLVEIMNKQ
ncbi:glycerophosphodiester phosphodiesterase [Paenibacillus alginolyticus]|uniref:Glycerophosphodiester phosphodiesterase n=1 Tax=Paenibacillus alginolyticus TaxID=59839 RepID=A0ABT4GG29_9BACL|nr:glycerophosphodiester phosphodiesterase family protein [Paenibacillus alginolyticus]MCY9695150.1 glycerophosphodiester phosphodiesterase [Paenibacillus alginolyticus]MEC0148679.1 glycerophosphodiester phosphodiesterase family protein [Paenibacillus alginolyticus]